MGRFSVFAGVMMLALPLVLGACADMRERASVAQKASAIIGGAASTTNEDAVVALAIRPAGMPAGLCSATVVAPNLVLTARHCVAVADDFSLCTADGVPVEGAIVYSDFAAGDLWVYRGVGANQEAASDPPTTPAAARGRMLVVEGSTLCNADLAFLVLDRELPGPYAPIRLRKPVVGEALTGIGYGLTESGNLPTSRQARVGIPVLEVGRLDFGVGSGLGDAELVVGESSCYGDSGGPLLSPSTGAVVGVVSRGAGGTGPAGNPAADCIGPSAYTFYTHLATKPDFVARAYAAAGHVVWAEGEPTPYVAMGGCSAASDCGSFEACDPISRTCTPVDASDASAGSDHDGGAARPDAMSPAGESLETPPSDGEGDDDARDAEVAPPRAPQPEDSTSEAGSSLSSDMPPSSSSGSVSCAMSTRAAPLSSRTNASGTAVASVIAGLVLRRRRRRGSAVRVG